MGDGCVKRNPVLRPTSVDTVVGVDFSAASDAGRRIWICGVLLQNGGAKIGWVQPAEDLPGGGRNRDVALAALRQYLSGRRGVLAGLDFPFSLPAGVMVNSEYREFLTRFGARFGSAELFRAACRLGGRGSEPKRVTDVTARAPFAPANLRMYRQTFYGIRDVLAPLVGSGGARVVPMMAPAPDTITLIEICPAVFLKRLGLYRPYKGSGNHLRASRAGLLDALVERAGMAGQSPSMRRTIIGDEGGDALDSVIAAVATHAALTEGRIALAPHGDIRRIEGEIM